MTPPWVLTQILIGVANVLPKKKLVPQKDLAEAAFREIKKRELVCVFFFTWLSVYSAFQSVYYIDLEVS